MLDCSANFTVYVQRPSSITQTNILSSGNAGTLVRGVDTIDDSSRIYAYLIDYSPSPDNGLIYINGSSASNQNLTSTNNTSSFSSSKLSITGTSGITFRFGAILLYNRYLSDSEVVSVNSYLTGIYSIV
jgi:hypothetical protein